MLGALAELVGELLPLLLLIAAIAVVTYFVLRRLGANVSVTSGSAPGSAPGAHRFSFNTTIADPLVYRLDADSLGSARRRLAAGEDLDAVCRDLEPAYATWSSGQREAFRRLIETALKESGL